MHSQMTNDQYLVEINSGQTGINALHSNGYSHVIAAIFDAKRPRQDDQSRLKKWGKSRNEPSP
jgi:hypothetical protein